MSEQARNPKRYWQGKRGQGEAAAWLREHMNEGPGQCLTWPFSRQDGGYGILGHLGKHFYAHRFMCELAHGPAPSPQHVAAHSCGRGHQGCVHPRHLSWKLPTANQQDSVAHGTHYFPLPGKRQKLTHEQVSEIKALRPLLTLNELSLIYSVTKQTIWKAYNGKTWQPTKYRPRGIPAAERPQMVLRAFTMRSDGATFQAIGNELSVSAATARVLILEYSAEAS